MGLGSWWRSKREAARARAENMGLNTDQEVIAQQVPELVGMSDVEGMAYVFRQLDEWNKNVTEDQAIELAGRLIASNRAWEEDGKIMPYWGNLWVLRTYQAELGILAPTVAPDVGA